MIEVRPSDGVPCHTRPMDDGDHEVRWRRAAVYAVCRDDDRRLLLTRLSVDSPAPGTWTMPGGGMEWGETSEETVARELFEETGLSGTVGRVLGVYSWWFAPGEAASSEPGHVVGIVHEMTDLEGSLRTDFDEGTTDAAAWFGLDEIEGLPHVPLVDYVVGLL